MEIEKVQQGQPERRFTSIVVEAPAEESRKVEGYALLFDTPSDGLYFEEVIERGALDGVIPKSDVFALLNHDRYRGILARRNSKASSLTLEVDTKGLRYSFDAPKTALGDELLENLRRGEVTESSFAFTVAEDVWENKADGTKKRTIRKIEKLYDVSPVYSGAYSKTSVYTRGADELDERRAAEEKEQKRVADLSAYYESLEKSINQFNS